MLACAMATTSISHLLPAQDVTRHDVEEWAQAIMFRESDVDVVWLWRSLLEHKGRGGVSGKQQK